MSVPAEDDLVELMAAVAYDAFSRRPGAWYRAKPATKESFKAEARAVLAVLRERGIIGAG